jgi:NADPH:quinone reductase-like Zn-dependent oxidoreductase
MGLPLDFLSRKIRGAAKSQGVHYEFFFMHASGAQLRELASLYDAGALRRVLDRTFPFDQTLEALAYVEQGKAIGKVVITTD